MPGYIARRIGGLLFIWFVAVLISFAALQFVPGDPILVLLSDQSGDAALEARLRADYGLDRSLPLQFIDYIGSIADGSFGLSYRFAGREVIEIIEGGMWITPLLAITALVIAVPLGVFLGIAAATRAGQLADTAIILLLVCGISIPNFALATTLVWLLSIKAGLLPVAGWGSFSQMILPVVVLTVPPVAYIARLTRSYMLEVFEKDYIRTARAKGVRDRLVVWRHALRNTLVPLLTSIGIIFGGLLSGSFVVETIFNIPGLGRIAIESIFARDYPVTMSVVLLFTVFYSLINLAVDLSYALIDPRIRLQGQSA
ncbi:ABC transporter permease subunit [Rhodobacteraceae bacterium 2CG4]|uniref:ABC transporter permease subunit n=1 Tax=Halovulum marinum TaxID=2662447 RepID=A0A6L5Z306_9RHOB|nr:ABC transporter permease [Halovulum marinum]MSU90928.1 ABC transporter permease subunit [Halovulum marinum]